jgi:hypothetical protein
MKALLFASLAVLALCALSTGHAQKVLAPELSLRNLAHQIKYELPDSQDIKCGFSIIAGARSLRDAMHPQVQKDLDRILQRDTLEASVVIGAFRIHFDTSTVNAPILLDSLGNASPGGYRAFVDSVGAIANHVLDYETNVLGYDPPPSDNGAGGGNEYDIYIENIGNVYGYTYPEAVVNQRGDGSTWTSYITIDNDFIFVHPRRNIGLPALEVTLAHEFHHAIQMGSYGYWESHAYFYEITSTWMEDVVYNDVNDYLNYLSAYFTHSERQFTSTGGAIEYAHCLWGHFVAKRFGRDVMRNAWVNMRSAVPLEAMDNALRSDSSSFQRAFGEWIKWNYFTGSRSRSAGDSVLFYPEGGSYPQVAQTAGWFVPPTRTFSNSLQPLSARFHKIASGSDTLILALANQNYGEAVANSVEQFPYTLVLSSTEVDPTYYSTPIGVFFKLDVADVQNWKTHAFVGDTVITTSYKMVIGKPFPNPYYVAPGKSLGIPVSVPPTTQGRLTVLSSNFDLLYAADVFATADSYSDQQVFEWNGRTNRGELAQSGIYFLILEVLDQTMTAKVAVVRR